jgi:hypothetical protein
MIVAGDWKMVAVDLSALCIGLVLACAAWKMSGKRVEVRASKPVAAPTLQTAD